jgi:hypothetical protein
VFARIREMINDLEGGTLVEKLAWGSSSRSLVSPNIVPPHLLYPPCLAVGQMDQAQILAMLTQARGQR